MQCTGHCSELDGAVPSQDYRCSAVGKYLRDLSRYCHGSPMDCIDIHGFRVSPIGPPPELGDVSLIIEAELPKNNTGKVLKAELRARFAVSS